MMTYSSFHSIFIGICKAKSCGAICSILLMMDYCHLLDVTNGYEVTLWGHSSMQYGTGNDLKYKGYRLSAAGCFLPCYI